MASRSKRPTSAAARSSSSRADRQPAHHRGADRAALGRRVLDRRRPPRPLLGVPGRAPDQGPARRHLRPRPPEGAGRRARRRWAASAPSRGRIPRSSRSASTPRAVGRPVQLDRDPLREHGRDAAWSRPGATRQARRHPRRPDHRLPPRRRCRRRGATRSSAPCCPMMTMRMATGVYDIANVASTGVSVVTNAVSTTAYRGAGRPEAAVAIERMVDRFAAEIGMDPAEVRRRNFVPRFMDRYTTGVGTVYDVGDYPEALERVLAAADYDELRAEQARTPGRERSGRSRHRARGVRRDHGRRARQRVRRRRAARRRAASACTAVRRRSVRATTPPGRWSWPTARVCRSTTSRSCTATPTRCASGGLTVGSRSVQIGGAAIATATGKLVDARP